MSKLNEKKASVKVAKKSHKKSLAGSQALSMGDVVAPGGESDNAAPKGRRQVLLDCPCCGACSSLHHRGIDDTWYVSCVLCKMSTAPETMPETAIAIWNRRVSR